MFCEPGAIQQQPAAARPILKLDSFAPFHFQKLRRWMAGELGMRSAFSKITSYPPGGCRAPEGHSTRAHIAMLGLCGHMDRLVTSESSPEENSR